MNNFKIIISISILLTACNSTKHRDDFVPEAAESGQAIIYLYRPGVMPNAIYSPDLYIDNEFKLSIKNGKNTRISLSPGEHLLEIDPEQKFAGDTRLLLDLIAGEIRYVSIGTSLKISSAVNYEPYKRRFNMKEMDESSALSQISTCCLNKKRDDNIQADKIFDDKEDNTSNSFSVDKTQNPFSH